MTQTKTTKTQTKNAVKTVNKREIADPLDNMDFRKHGVMAAKKWEAAERSGMVGDALFALALAEYMETTDRMLVVVTDRAGVEQGRHLVKLSERGKVQTEWSKERAKLSALNNTIFEIIVGKQDLTKTQIASNKSHLQRAYPAALQLLARSKELGVPLSSAIIVREDGRVTVKEYIADTTKELPKTEDEKLLTKNLPLQVKSLGQAYIDAHPTTTEQQRAPHGHTSETPKTDTPKSADDRLKDARALSAKAFTDACSIIMQRINDITNSQPTAIALEGAELDKLARLSKSLARFEAMKSKQTAQSDAKAAMAKDADFGKMAADGRNH